jgi:predicted nucleic acid-binding protein
MAAPLYLLDTCVLLALIRGKALGRRIEASFHLREQRYRPLICVVSHGEIWVTAKSNDWGAPKLDALKKMLDNLVTVDITAAVIRSYVDIDLFSRALKPAVNMQKNDLWIAAAARASDAILLTTDRDFDHLPLALVKHEFIDPGL